MLHGASTDEPGQDKPGKSPMREALSGDTVSARSMGVSMRTIERLPVRRATIALGSASVRKPFTSRMS